MNAAKNFKDQRRPSYCYCDSWDTLYNNIFYLEHSSLSSWNDSETETSINFNQNNNLLKAKVNIFSY